LRSISPRRTAALRAARKVAWIRLQRSCGDWSTGGAVGADDRGEHRLDVGVGQLLEQVSAEVGNEVAVDVLAVAAQRRLAGS
jgi:hypothetical protein